MENLEQRWFSDPPQIINANIPHMALAFLIDTSGAMGGVPLHGLNEGLNRFQTEVCKDAQTRSILDVAIIEFNSTHSVVQEFGPVEYMWEVELMGTGGAIISPAIEKALDMVTDRTRFYQSTGTPPYRPWVILITNGAPNDDISGAIRRIKKMEENGKVSFRSLGLEGYDSKVLHDLCGPKVMKLTGYDFTKFFDWVSKSMRSVYESSPHENPKAVDLDGEFVVVDTDWDKRDSESIFHVPEIHIAAGGIERGMFLEDLLHVLYGILEDRGFAGFLTAIRDALRDKLIRNPEVVTRDIFYHALSWKGIDVAMELSQYYWQPYGGMRNKQQFQRFCAEWALWKHGVSEPCSVGEQWLFKDRSKRNTEAGMSDKHKVFQLLDAMMIPIACFEPCPENIPCPRLTITKSASRSVYVKEEIKVDNGLFSEKNPYGKTFELLLASGATVRITISEPKCLPPVWRFEGKGTIDGYALINRERDITIDDPYVNKSVFSFGFRLDDPTVDGGFTCDGVRYNHPLWSKFRQWYETRTWYLPRNVYSENTTCELL